MGFQVLDTAGRIKTLDSDAARLSLTNAFTGANSFATNPLDLLVGQLKFPATQNASSDANTLDDYEEGTWTPTITGSGGSSGQAYDIQIGRYVKLGLLVWLQGYVRLSTLGTITGNVIIGGLPFTLENVTNMNAPGACVWEGLVLAVGSVIVFPLGNTATARIYYSFGDGTTNENQFIQANLQAGSGFQLSIGYRATD